jgi:hypothetical protein
MHLRLSVDGANAGGLCRIYGYAHSIAFASVLTQTDSTGQRSSLTRMASADVVQTKGLGLALCSAR